MKPQVLCQWSVIFNAPNVSREGPPLPNDRGFGAYGGVAVPYGDSFVYVGGSTIDANSADLYR